MPLHVQQWQREALKRTVAHISGVTCHSRETTTTAGKAGERGKHQPEEASRAWALSSSVLCACRNT